MKPTVFLTNFSLKAASWPIIFVAVAAIYSLSPTTIAQQNNSVDLALVLAVDCSHSVNDLEFDLQMQGFSQAFSSEEIIAAIVNKKVAVTLVQWSGRNNQIISVPWTIVEGRGSALVLAKKISSTQRLALGKTSISAAVDFGISALLNSPYTATRMVIDISADGVNNDGATAKSARQRALSANITINGLAILNDVPNLHLYFEQFVIAGAGSFVISADDYQSYAEAIKTKLQREIRNQPVS